MMFLLGQQIFSNRMLSIIPPVILSFESIFKNQLIYSPLLDIFQLFFLLSCFYFFNKAILTKKIFKNLVIANVFLGFFMATKFFITGITIVIAWILVLFLRKKWYELKSLILYLPVSILVMLSSYIRLFAFDYSIRSFLGVQKYVFLYHKSQLILPFTIWPLLLFNRWYVWFGDKSVISDGQWSITWPIVTILSLVTVVLYVFKKIPKNKYVDVLIVWFLSYVAFFSFGQISSRYFVILIPVLYIISLYGLIEVYKIYRK